MKGIETLIKIFKWFLVIVSIGVGIIFLTLGDHKPLVWVISIYIGYFVLTEIIRSVVRKVLKEYKLIEE